jgi:uncharacterized protein YrrD
MLHSVRELKKYTIGATDGMIGDITDFYFDDEAWIIRYLEVDTGTWLSGRRVLISPFSIGVADRAARVFPVSTRTSPSRASMRRAISAITAIRIIGEVPGFGATAHTPE